MYIYVHVYAPGARINQTQYARAWCLVASCISFAACMMIAAHNHGQTHHPVLIAAVGKIQTPAIVCYGSCPGQPAAVRLTFEQVGTVRSRRVHSGCSIVFQEGSVIVDEATRCPAVNAKTHHTMTTIASPADIQVCATETAELLGVQHADKLVLTMCCK